MAIFLLEVKRAKTGALQPAVSRITPVILVAVLLKRPMWFIGPALMGVCLAFSAFCGLPVLIPAITFFPPGAADGWASWMWENAVVTEAYPGEQREALHHLGDRHCSVPNEGKQRPKSPSREEQHCPGWVERACRAVVLNLGSSGALQPEPLWPVLRAAGKCGP